jgi:hypothetical protein
VERELGGSLPPRLNTDEIPIAKKYREGKMKSTSEGELKEPEIVGREAFSHLSSYSSGFVRHYWFYYFIVLVRLLLRRIEECGS